MTTTELKEQLQEDIMTYLDGMGDEVIGDLCVLIVNRVNQLDPLYTEEDMRKAYKFGSLYSKGTIAQAQEYKIEKLLK